MKPKKNKKESGQWSKLKRIMTEKNIEMKELHEGTGIANPTLFNIYFARKIELTDFRDRTLRDLETFLKVPREQFIGLEDKSITESIRKLIESNKVEVKKKVKVKGSAKVAEEEVVESKKD